MSSVVSVSPSVRVRPSVRPSERGFVFRSSAPFSGRLSAAPFTAVYAAAAANGPSVRRPVGHKKQDARACLPTAVQPADRTRPPSVACITSSARRRSDEILFALELEPVKRQKGEVKGQKEDNMETHFKTNECAIDLT